jgi:hypothetical protein
MSNKAYQEMTEFFKERNLTVPSVFTQFADSVAQEPDIARWRVGEPPAAWPFASPGESGESLPNTSGSFTNFVSVGFTWYEPFDDIDGEYSDAEICLRLATRGLLMELRISEGHKVLKGGGNGWDVTPDSEWIPFWNEAMRDLTSYAKKVDLFAQFDNVAEAFTPENAFCFDALRDRITSFTFAGGAESVMHESYVDGPPGLGELLWETRDDDVNGHNIDEDDFIEFLDSNRLDEPPYFADYYQFIERDEGGFGWRLPGGPDIPTFADYMRESFATALENPISPQLALNHAGHGINSDGLNLRMQVGAVLIVAQYGWGGGYMDVDEQRKAWNEGMDALHEFFDEIDLNVDIFAKPEPREIEVAIRYSEFRGSEAQVRDKSGEWTAIDCAGRLTLGQVLKRVLKKRDDSWGLF